MVDIDDIRMKNELATYDAAARGFLSERIILAWILKYCVSEFKDCEIKDIATKYIENGVEVAEIPIEPDKTNALKIIGEANEYKTVTEGTSVFDIRFSAFAPNGGEKIKLIINIEAQKKHHPGYNLVKRGIFHCARLLSSQYNVEFKEPEFDKIKKVYSIWLTFTTPQGVDNGITQYKVVENKLVGNIEQAQKNYDLLQVIMIYIGTKEKKIENQLLKMLHLLFRKKADAVSKKQQLKERFDIELNSKMTEELNIMCNLGEGIAEEAMEAGIAQGLAQGIEQGEIKKAEKIAIKMLKKGDNIKDIAELTELSIDRIRQLEFSIK